jgi:hypothetical protein
MGRKGSYGGGGKSVKGGSGSSNPEGNKFRTGARAASTAAARAQGSGGGKSSSGSGGGGLTAGGLLAHNDRLDAKAPGAGPASTASSGAQSTAALFEQVRRKASSVLESDRETCAVLAVSTWAGQLFGIVRARSASGLAHEGKGGRARIFSAKRGSEIFLPHVKW